ncbi:UNVERIFIED_CONTAM: hypothetical protein Sradi_4102300 [Sesamum radiatum]|uniref:Uncharacterized protein n=1 Tax=Sesamum radiatum TaxID=300843 RepID=A0AAW2P233_SESRA
MKSRSSMLQSMVPRHGEAPRGIPSKGKKGTTIFGEFDKAQFSASSKYPVALVNKGKGVEGVCSQVFSSLEERNDQLGESQVVVRLSE